jgi:hypothetical protein
MIFSFGFHLMAHFSRPFQHFTPWGNTRYELGPERPYREWSATQGGKGHIGTILSSKAPFL